MTSISPLMPFLIIVGLIVIFAIILPITLLCVVLAGRRNKTAASTPVQPEATPVNPEARNQRREAILDQLAKKEITSEDAEQQLLELDNPLPEQMPVTPPKSGCGMSLGCLVAAICGLFIFVVLAVVLLMQAFHVAGFQPPLRGYDMIRIEKMR
jgi:hypothetical protein